MGSRHCSSLLFVPPITPAACRNSGDGKKGERLIFIYDCSGGRVRRGEEAILRRRVSFACSILSARGHG